MSDVVTRDAAHCYVVQAHKGQTLAAELTPQSSSDAVILVFRPGWGYRDVDGFRLMDGKALPTAGRDDAAHSVKARLPESGRYLIEMAPSRGDAAAYDLRITLH